MNKHLIFASIKKKEIEMLIEYNQYNILVSYYYLFKSKPFLNKMIEVSEQIKQNNGIFMLDSGAYSAWRKGININLFDYIEFIKEYHKYFTHIVCLDVINEPIVSEVNHKIMLNELKDYDLTIIPVFHAGETFRVLDYMIERDYKYIGISPNNNWNEKQKRQWLNRVYQYDFEKLDIKTHLFGYSSLKGMKYYNFFSADSTSWSMSAIKGKIYNGSIDGSLINTIPENFNTFVFDICDKYNLDVNKLLVCEYQRRKFNICALSELLPKVFDIHL